MNRIRGFLSKVSKGFAFFRKTLTNRAVRENAILLLTAPLFPKLHIRLRVKYGHYIPENPIDLSHPKLFNEPLYISFKSNYFTMGMEMEKVPGQLEC